MRADAAAMWRELKDFQVGPTDVPLTFVDRLARENGWSKAFASSVFTEYKRFVVLAHLAPHPVTPSDAVDQAWHLHLSYTRSYWSDLCDEILGQPLHHGPTQGGSSETQKYREWYSRTLELYAELFGHAAPADVWPPGQKRFRNVEAFRQVNTREQTVLPISPLLLKAALAAISLPLLLGGCARVASWTGISQEGLWLIAFVALSGFLVVRASRRARKDRKGGSGCAGGCSGCGACGGCGGCGG